MRAVFIRLLITYTLISDKLVFGEEGTTAPPEEELYGVKYASKCEVCKYVITELEGRLSETGKSHDVIETGYNVLDEKKMKKKKYSQSELRLVETMDGVCERLLEYNIHKERKDSKRFDKGMSQTFKTLHGLVDKGVKVDLGIPYELWDKPSAEITHLKIQCEIFLETYEEDIENWYFKDQNKRLMEYICVDRALKNDDTSCLLNEKKRDEL